MSRETRRGLGGRIAVVLILIAIAVAILSSPLRGYLRPSEFMETLTTLRESIDAIWYAPIAFITVLVIASTCFVPVSIFVIASAFFWGWLEGGVYSLIGTIISSGISFELSRYVFGDLARKIFEKRLGWLHRVFDTAGVRSIMLLRLVPGIPFPVFNFGAGLTSLRSRDYMIGSAIGLSIPVFIITFSTDALLAGTMTRGDVGWRVIIAAILLAFLVIGVPFAVRRLRPSGLADPSNVDPGPESVVN